MNKKKDSKIFHKTELEEIKRQEKGDYKDKFGIMSARVKPKIKELLEVWFPKRNELKRLLTPKRKKKDSRG